MILHRKGVGSFLRIRLVLYFTEPIQFNEYLDHLLPEFRYLEELDVQLDFARNTNCHQQRVHSHRILDRCLRQFLGAPHAFELFQISVLKHVVCIERDVEKDGSLRLRKPTFWHGGLLDLLFIRALESPIAVVLRRTRSDQLFFGWRL